MKFAGPAIALASSAVASTSAFALLATAVAHRATSRADRAARPRLKARKGHPVRSVAKRAAPLGKWWSYVPAAAGASAWLLLARRDEAGAGARGVGAASVVAAAVLAAVGGPVMDRVLPQPPAPPGHRRRRKPVFPSGHAMGPGAASMTAAWILAREGELEPERALAMALGIPSLSTGGKLIEEKHWLSDSAGGLLAAAAIASLCLVPYELARARR